MSAQQPLRLWLGGSFNPVHLGHLRLASRLAQCLPARVSLLPTGVSAFGKDLAPVGHRLRMLQLAIEDYPDLAIDSCETDRGGVSYTSDTFASLRSTYGKAAHLTFVLGEDALADLHTWRNYRQLLCKTNLLVLLRDPVSGSSVADMRALPVAVARERLAKMPRLVEQCIAPALTDDSGWKNSPHGGVVFWHNPLMRVSATMIRRLVRHCAWEELPSYLPASVLNYIREVQLYS